MEVLLIFFVFSLSFFLSQFLWEKSWGSIFAPLSLSLFFLREWKGEKGREPHWVGEVNHLSNPTDVSRGNIFAFTNNHCATADAAAAADAAVVVAPVTDISPWAAASNLGRIQELKPGKKQENPDVCVPYVRLIRDTPFFFYKNT